MVKHPLNALFTKPRTLDEATQVIAVLLDAVSAQQAQLDALLDQRATHSQNSSKPPSSDTPEERSARPKTKRSSGRKPGGQPGHTGHYRRLHPESEVDQVEHWYPGQCQCGGSVALTEQPPHRHQIIDLPEVSPVITEHQLHHGHCCRCGAKQCARLPDALSRSPFGPRLHACIALLNAQFHLSDRQVKDYLQQFWSLPMSLGAISGVQGRITPWLWPLAESVRDQLRHSPWVHADETTHWRHTSRWWMWVMATPQAAYFQVHYSRGKGAASNLLSEEYQGILISDRCGAYRVIPNERRQLCLPHVIRNFKKMADKRGIDGQLGRHIMTALRLLVRIDHKRQRGLSLKAFRRRCLRVRDRLAQLLQRGILMGRKKTRDQCACLYSDMACLFTFVLHPGLPLTNNEAERALRPYVIWRKTSFATQSARGDRFRAFMLTVVETCKRQGLSALNVLQDTCRQGLSGQPITSSVFAV